MNIFPSFQAKGRFLRLIVLVALILLPACVSGPDRSRERSVALPAGTKRIALLPVLLADRAQDRFVEQRTRDEILWQTKRVLKNKGYVVISVADPSPKRFLQPFTPKSEDPATLVSLAPEDVDAVMVIRIDHFLDAALYGGGDHQAGFGGGRESLDLYATAELLSRQDHRSLWRRKAIGTSNEAGVLGFQEMQAAHDLVDGLLVTFPGLEQ